MVPAQILKRLIARCSQPLLRVVPLNQLWLFRRLTQVVSLFLSEATITKTPFSTNYERFGCPILSSCMRNFSARFTTDFMYRLYSRLQEIYNIARGFLLDQICYELNYGLSLQPLNNQFKYVRFI